jgi:glycine/D-amino acid oxidase-like deaminating enzyme
VNDVHRSWADAEQKVFWLDRPDAPEPSAPLTASEEADLVVVGGGFTGLWAALQAKEEDPSRDVVIVEADTIAFGASGRNGGFCDSSLTHGLPNGLDRFPNELERIEAQAVENFDGIRETVRRYGIDCDWLETGEILVAREPHELRWIEESVELMRRFGYEADVLAGEQLRSEIASPTYLGGAWKRSGCAMIDPARLAWGLRAAAIELGVRIHERSPVLELIDDQASVRLRTRDGQIRAPRVVLATNGFPPLVPRIRRYVVPVYDYVLMTEPLSEQRWASVGWKQRQGLADMANQFHYYRVSEDGRILWGGYDAVYHWRNGVDPALEDRPETFDLLATHFFETFPQLEGLRFSHRWAGVIDTCSRFSVFFDTALGGKVAYAVGYTGMGVGATRFGARVALDLLEGVRTERTSLDLVRKRPMPFPPEPLRSLGIAITRRALDRADRRQGRRGPWLRLLDRVGLGFDS